MGISRLDVAFVHDISSDNKLLPAPWQEQFSIALKDASPRFVEDAGGGDH
jgi:D-threo-aldose 1-dehydrogenase